MTGVEVSGGAAGVAGVTSEWGVTGVGAVGAAGRGGGGGAPTTPLAAAAPRAESSSTHRAARVPGAGDSRTYVRVLKTLNVSEDAQQTRVVDLLGAAVFNNLAMKAIVDEEPEEGTATATFLKKLRTMPSLHFAEAPPAGAAE